MDKKTWEERQLERDKIYREREEEREKKQKERDEKREKEQEERDEEKRKTELGKAVSGLKKDLSLDPLMNGNPAPALAGICSIALKCKLRPLPGAKSAAQIAEAKAAERTQGNDQDNEQGQGMSMSPDWRR